MSKGERRRNNLTHCQYPSALQRLEHLAGQNIESVKNKSIISRHMNLGDTRSWKGTRPFWKESRMLNCIATRRLHLGGQKNEKTLTHSYWKTKSYTATKRERLRYDNNWALGINGEGPTPGPVKQRKDYPQAVTKVKSMRQQAEQPSNPPISFKSPNSTQTYWGTTKSGTAAMEMEKLAHVQHPGPHKLHLGQWQCSSTWWTSPNLLEYQC